MPYACIERVVGIRQMIEVVEILEEMSTRFLVLAGVLGFIFVIVFFALISVLEKIRDELKKLNSDR